MRKVTFGVANSLDNYIARQDHAVDWLLWDKEVSSLISEFRKTIDTVVMGRKTYEVALKNGMASYPGVHNYVFSKTLPASKEESVEIISGDAAEFIRNLKKQPGKGICVMGGGELARSLFEAGVIDEVTLNIHPVLLGSGIPLFPPMQTQVDMNLEECRTLRTGCVCLTYRVKHRAGRTRKPRGPASSRRTRSRKSV
jgi:dihydrofolate reductase